MWYKVAMSKTVNIKLRIDEETHEALKQLAGQEERSVAAEIRLAIRLYLRTVTVPA